MLIRRGRNGYGIDLRKRIITAYESGDIIDKIAKRFEVSSRTVSRLIKLKRETGGLEPRKVEKGSRSKIRDLEKFKKFVENFKSIKKNFIGKDLIIAWEALTCVRVSSRTLYKALKDVGYTYKKKTSFTLKVKTN